MKKPIKTNAKKPTKANRNAAKEKIEPLPKENEAKKAARERGQRARAYTSVHYPVPTKMGWVTETRTSKSVDAALKRAIALSKSASDFDDWFCVYLDSLDGDDAKKYSPEYMGSALRDDLWVGGGLDWPNDADHDWEYYDSMLKLKEWERVARNWSMLLLAAQQLKLTFTATVAAKVIGEIIGFRLDSLDFAAPRIVSEGLLNLIEGKPFKTGCKPSDTLVEVSAAYYTFVSNRIFDPSQTEVGAYLEGKGTPVSRPVLSKAFDALGLKTKSGDARSAGSDAGKRRRLKG